MRIRAAKPGEAALLSELALQSKAYWGYSQAFLEACRMELTLTEVYIAKHPVFVLEDKGVLLGFYGLSDKGEATAELDYLFVEPGAIGRGIGKKLWEHAVKTARRSGYQELYIISDPNSEAFYARMGARRDGETSSPVQVGRQLPVMRFELKAL